MHGIVNYFTSMIHFSSTLDFDKTWLQCLPLPSVRGVQAVPDDDQGVVWYREIRAVHLNQHPV